MESGVSLPEVGSEVSGGAVTVRWRAPEACGGFLWIATRSGLSRFDGRIFRKHESAEGLPSPRIQDVLEGPCGSIWLATAPGVARLAPEADSGRGLRPARRRADFEVVGEERRALEVVQQHDIAAGGVAGRDGNGGDLPRLEASGGEVQGVGTGTE